MRKRLGDELREIRLFGSRAKGTNSPTSDYDILIVLKRREPRLIDLIYSEAQELELKHGVDISFKIYGESDFRRRIDSGAPFMNEIKTSSLPL